MTPGIAEWPAEWITVAVLVAAGAIALAGVRLTRIADHLADVTGLGEALFGAVLLGATTSLSGITTSVSTAWFGFGELSVSNAIGGIAVQTAFLSIADITYRRVNLEHAAASTENLFQAGLLVLMLNVPLLAKALPSLTIFAVHPASIVLLVVYVTGLRIIREMQSAPGWRAERTRETVSDEEGEAPPSGSAPSLWTQFALLALVVGVAGYVVGRLGIGLVEQVGLSETVVGVLVTAVATSLPELVTSLAAVRQRALNLAVGGIIGGNAFDVLFLSFSDLAYRDGSIYHAMTHRQVFLILISILMAIVLLLGLLRRERTGPANIGLESVLILAIYACSVLALTRL